MVIKYEELLCKAKKMDAAITSDLEWMLIRCVLESKPILDEADSSTLSDINGLKLMNTILNCAVIKEYFCEGEIVSDEKIKEIDTKKFQEDFWVCLSQKEEMSEDFWRSYPEKFIRKLAYYRHRGSIDGNLSGKLLDFAKKINNDPLRYIYELIQNADDCEYYDNVEKSVTIKFDGESMTVSYPEVGMTYSDIIAITTIGQSNKQKKKVKKIIGEKGIGFKTIFSVCDSIEIYSGPYRFKLTQNDFRPQWIERNEGDAVGTKLILYFKDEIEIASQGEKGDGIEKNRWKCGRDVYEKVLKKYGIDCNGKAVPQNIFKNCPIMFTNKIEKLCICYEEQSLIIKRDINEENEIISYWINKKENAPADVQLSCLRIEKSIEFSYEEYISHYKEVFISKEEYDNVDVQVKTYPIILLVPAEINEGGEKRGLEDIKQGNIFTYLPTFANINAPISMQLPFELNEDRSCMWIQGMKGDDHIPEDYHGMTTKWNNRLFEEAFISKEGNKCLLEFGFDVIRDKGGDVLCYVPEYRINNHYFFMAQDIKYDADIDKLNKYCGEGGTNLIFNCFKQMKILKTLDGKSWICFNDRPIMFDGFVSNILKRILKENMEDSQLNILLGHIGGCDAGTASVQKERIIGRLIDVIDINRYGKVEALGITTEKMENETKVEFANALLHFERKEVIQELLKEKCSSYLPENNSNDRKKLKVLKVQTESSQEEYWAFSDAALWINLGGEHYSIINSLAFYDNEKNIIEDDENNKRNVSDIYGEKNVFCIPKNSENVEEIWSSIWGKIGFASGNSPEIECTYRLIEDIMRLISTRAGHNDWFEYAKKIIIGDVEAGNMQKDLISLWEHKKSDFRKELGSGDVN